MLVGLRRDHRLLNTRQKLLCPGQRQPQICDSPSSLGWLISSKSTLRARLSVPVSTASNIHPKPDPPQPATTRPVIWLPS